MAELQYEQVDSLPPSTRGGGIGGGSPYKALIQDCVDHPGTWYKTSANSASQAYTRAATLRGHGLSAHARGSDVYVAYVENTEQEQAAG